MVSENNGFRVVINLNCRVKAAEINKETEIELEL